jgi:hypothetical protein
MVDTTLFGPLFTRIVPVSSMYRMLVDLGAATPTPIITGVGLDVVQTNFRCVNFYVWNNSGGAQGGATAQLQSDLNGAGLVAISDAVAIAVDNAVGRAATMDPAQADLTFGQPVAEDILSIAKNAAGDAGIATILCYLL